MYEIRWYCINIRNIHFVLFFYVLGREDGRNIAQDKIILTYAVPFLSLLVLKNLEIRFSTSSLDSEYETYSSRHSLNGVCTPYFSSIILIQFLCT
jgi:hypothetical protein